MMLGTMTRSLTIALTSFLLWASPLYATSDNIQPLQPFLASYELDWDGPVSISGDTVRELKKTAQGEWQFQSKATSMFASIFEETNFKWGEQTLLPIHYTFKRSVFGKKRSAVIRFDWTNYQVTNDVENKPWQMAITAGVQDKLSYQLLLQQELAKGKQEFSYSVADGGTLKEYKFKVIGEEKIQAPIGTYDAIRVQRVRDADNPRQTFIWFAPELDFQIIKLKQIEKKNKAYTLLLKKLTK